MKTSIRAAVAQAKREDAKLRRPTGSASVLGAATADSFVNFAHKLGIGADNILSSGTYGYNPITRNRTLLEWIHRGSWLGGQAVDIPADDMTRAGVDITCEMKPDDIGRIERAAVTHNIWPTINSVIKWSRLYGGAIGVALIDGQDPKTPLRPETVGPGKFKGILTLDRWMVDPSLGDLCTEYGPSLGLPNYYSVQDNAPALRGQVVHRSRVLFRLEGVELPYQQRLTENLWGISVLERLYDRMIAFDSATTGAAQLVFKSHLRTLKIEGLRDIVASGGDLMAGLMSYTEVMRRYQGIEGMTLLDMTDEFEVQGSGPGAMSGISDVLTKLGEQLSGALQIPLVRLFGQSPGGLGSGGEHEMAAYHEGIDQKQNKELRTGVTETYRLMAQSEGIKPPDDFAIDFRPLDELDDTQKAASAKSVGETVGKAMEDGIIGRQTALKELRNSSKRTGVFSNITAEMIQSADDEVLPPLAETAMQQEHEAALVDKEHEHQEDMTDKTHEHAHELADKGAKTALELAKTKSGKDKPGAKKKTGDAAPRRVTVTWGP
jgi:uncharacterized protein